jgi:hypothetical protein
MSANPFERRVAGWLASAGCWWYHPADIPDRKLWIPADFLVVCNGVFTALECKSLELGRRFPLSRWTNNQRQACADIRYHGGRYIILVNYAEFGAVVAHYPDPTTPRGSLSITDDGRRVDKTSIRHIIDVA